MSEELTETSWAASETHKDILTPPPVPLLPSSKISSPASTMSLEGLEVLLNGRVLAWMGKARGSVLSGANQIRQHQNL